MRVMVLVKATEDSEKGFVRTADTMEMMEAMGKFNDELIKAGIMKDGNCDGLIPILFRNNINNPIPSGNAAHIFLV